MSRINLTMDSHRNHDIRASRTCLHHWLRWNAAPGRETRSGAWSEHWKWIEMPFLTAARMTGKRLWNQPLMKWWLEKCGHYVNSLYLWALKITLIYLSQHWMMHWGDITRGRVLFGNRKCRCMRRPPWTDNQQEDPIRYETKRFKTSMLRWRFSCTGLKRVQQQNEVTFRCAWTEPNKRQPNGQMLIGRDQKSDWSAKSIQWHTLNANFSRIILTSYATTITGSQD